MLEGNRANTEPAPRRIETPAGLTPSPLVLKRLCGAQGYTRGAVPDGDRRLAVVLAYDGELGTDIFLC